MTNSWEERISATSDALLVAEHEVRYGWARPAVEIAGTWCDLGCGTAAGSSRALRASLPERVVLVDAEAAAIDEARRAFAPREVEGWTIDLTRRSDLDELAARLLDGPGPIVLTCFEVIEHLPDFVPVVEWFSEMASEGATVAISVPNDVFTSVRNPYHVTMWGSSTVEELRGLLPADHVVAAQTALEGSVIDPAGGRSGDEPIELLLGSERPADLVPLQYMMGFGAGADRLGTAAVVLPTDVAGRRVWERQRETDNLYYRTEAARVPELEARIAELEAELAGARAATS